MGSPAVTLQFAFYLNPPDTQGNTKSQYLLLPTSRDHATQEIIDQILHTDAPADEDRLAGDLLTKHMTWDVGWYSNMTMGVSDFITKLEQYSQWKRADDQNDVDTKLTLIATELSGLIDQVSREASTYHAQSVASAPQRASTLVSVPTHQDLSNNTSNWLPKLTEFYENNTSFARQLSDWKSEDRLNRIRERLTRWYLKASPPFPHHNESRSAQVIFKECTDRFEELCNYTRVGYLIDNWRDPRFAKLLLNHSQSKSTWDVFKQEVEDFYFAKTERSLGRFAIGGSDPGLPSLEGAS